MEPIIVALITGGLALIGNIISVLASNNKTRSEMRITQAEMRKDIQHLTDEVKRHNNFAQRMPVVEEQIKVINKNMDELERRLT